MLHVGIQRHKKSLPFLSGYLVRVFHLSCGALKNNSKFHTSLTFKIQHSNTLLHRKNQGPDSTISRTVRDFLPVCYVSQRLNIRGITLIEILFRLLAYGGTYCKVDVV